MSKFLTSQEWKDLTAQLKQTEGITITSFARTDNQGYFVNYTYLTFEYQSRFYFVGVNPFDGMYITPYLKLSPYEYRQSEFPYTFDYIDDIFRYINNSSRSNTPLKGSERQRIYSDFYLKINPTTRLIDYIYKLCNPEQKEIFNNLEHIEMISNTSDEMIFRFRSGDKYFDYEKGIQKIIKTL